MIAAQWIKFIFLIGWLCTCTGAMGLTILGGVANRRYWFVTTLSIALLTIGCILLVHSVSVLQQ